MVSMHKMEGLGWPVTLGCVGRAHPTLYPDRMRQTGELCGMQSVWLNALQWRLSRRSAVEGLLNTGCFDLRICT
jgi:hypothetical protein